MAGPGMELVPSNVEWPVIHQHRQERAGQRQSRRIDGTRTHERFEHRRQGETQLGACLKRATRRIAFPTFAGDAFDVDIPIVVTAGE